MKNGLKKSNAPLLDLLFEEGERLIRRANHQVKSAELRIAPLRAKLGLRD